MSRYLIVIEKTGTGFQRIHLTLQVVYQLGLPGLKWNQT